MPHNKGHSKRKKPTTRKSKPCIDPRRMFYGGNDTVQESEQPVEPEQLVQEPQPVQPLLEGGKKIANKKRKTMKKKPMKKNEGYCLKCKKYRIINNAKEDKIKNGRPVLKGECIVCGTKMMKFI